MHRFTTNDPFVAFKALHTHIGTLEPGVLLGALWFGTWLPEPVSTGVAAGPLDASEQQDSLSMAFLLLLERLTPVERAAFQLHDVFGYGYEELVRILSKSEASCRQIVHRARRHINDVLGWGRQANAALRPLHGAMTVARFVLGAIAKSVPKDVSMNIELVNGQPSVVYRTAEGSAGCVVSAVVTDERITEVLIVTNPDKLVHIVGRS
jgi:RNA polymerase sigma-70 factor (ECF subfamily)